MERAKSSVSIFPPNPSSCTINSVPKDFPVTPSSRVIKPPAVIVFIDVPPANTPFHEIWPVFSSNCNPISLNIDLYVGPLVKLTDAIEAVAVLFAYA